MPGVNPPNSEYLLSLIGEMQKQIRALATQQQLVFTNAQGETVAATGLFPDGSGRYGIAGYSGSTGSRVFGVYDSTIPDGSGRRQTVVDIHRDDGTAALGMSDNGTVLNHPHQQALQWFDRSGNVVIADDTTSGTGVARPHIPMYALANTNLATWPGTSNTAVTTIASGYAEYQHPKVQFQIELFAPANVTGNFYLQYAGTNIAQTSVVGGASGQFTMWIDTVALPSGLTFGSVYSIYLQALVAAGTGTVSAQVYMLQAQGS